MDYRMEKEYSSQKTRNTLIGQWHQGKKHGIGWYQGSHSDYYLGQWENGRCFGFCIYFMETYMQVILLMIQNMVMDSNILKMVITLQENIVMVNLMVRENFIGLMVIVIKENLQMVKEMAMGFGKAKHEKEQIHIKANMPMIKNVVRDYLNMPMAHKAIYWVDGLMEGEGIYEYDTLVLSGNWRSNQLQTIDQVRVPLNEFPQQHSIKEIKENEEVKSELADEQDQVEIGNQFQTEILASKAWTNHAPAQNISHHTSHNDVIALVLPIQTESKKKFLPKLVLNKRTPTNRVDHPHNEKINLNLNAFLTLLTQEELINQINRIKFKIKKSKKICLIQSQEKQQNSFISNRIENLDNPNEQTKIKSCKIYQILESWIPEIKQFLYHPIWKPPSHQK